MKLTLRRGESIGDWWLIERAEHENRHWLEPIVSGPNASSAALRYSGRIGDADVEGTTYEMREIARAIEGRYHARFKRCAVSHEPGGVRFWSPRNSQKSELIPVADADELAREIWSKTASNEKLTE